MSDEYRKVQHKNRGPRKNVQNNNNKYRNKSAVVPRKTYDKDKRSRSTSPVERNSKLFMFRLHDKIDRPELIHLELMDVESIIIFLSKNKNAFKNLLTNNSNLDVTILFLRVISKIGSSSFIEHKNEIITQVWQNDYLQKLQDLISELISQTKTGRKSTIFFWEDQIRFWNDLLILYKTIFVTVPRSASEKLLSIIKSNQTAITEIHKNKLDAKLNNILEKLKILSKQIAMQREQQSFRNLNIFPTATEIKTETDQLIQKNISKGCYSSVELYLDVHFRLLREDYVRSMRTSICSYLENKTKSNVFENVKFIQPLISCNKVGILVKHNSNLKEIKFQHGSLVCFSKDNFETVAYGTIIIDEKSELASNEYLVIDVIDTIVYDVNYVMVTNKSSFETTNQILKALQNMKEENFPLKKYIVDVNKTIGHPKYLIQAAKDNKKLQNQINNKEENQYFQLFSNNTINPVNFYKLNSSQYKAFQTALTYELSIIQGPPGTGKTYTTLKIVDCLLKNKKMLNYSGPILIICYTNHALDQFLEGILPFCNDIVRVGRDSDNSKINNLNLRNHRWRSNDKFSFGKELLDLEKEKMDEIKQKIQCLQNLLEDLKSNLGVLNFKLFKSIDDKLTNTWFDNASNEDILEWLMVDINTRTIHNSFIKNITKPILYSKIEDNFAKTKIIDMNKCYDSTENFIDNYILTIPKIKENIESKKCVLFNMKTNYQWSEKQKLEVEIQELERKLNYLQVKLNKKDVNTLPDYINYNFPQKITADVRWILYHNWVELLHSQIYQDIAILDEKYREYKRRHQEIEHIVDTRIMQNKSIIGMTTSKAALLQPLLQTLKCQIVIVEEAAEVLESHIVAALTNHCQQLILIGDHQQLKPKSSDQIIGKDLNLELSLFERFINNGIPYHQLEVQHRMRPEFANLITPAIYSNLQNDDSVKNLPSVRGVSTNLFFVNHKSHEDHKRNYTSLTNTFEVKYIIKLAVYLIKQEYKTEEITILATYKRQMEALENESKLYSELQNIRIATVDNFQGEENKIILLSLVRSNDDENIGFLKSENRVCVALSRAKEGFYIVGNMKSFEKSSKIWPKVIDVLKKQNSIGPALILKCQRHNINTRIENYTDFDKILDGGCTALCGEKLSCGHTCTLNCHNYDRNHTLYICNERCNKIICNNNHKCPKLCSDPCGKCEIIRDKCLPCGDFKLLQCSDDPWEQKCVIIKKRTLPCNHEVEIECHENILKVICPFTCQETLDCGHKCQKKCHINTPNHEQYQCTQKCGKILECNHFCKKMCFMPCGDCQVMVNKIVATCGHTIRIKCNQEPEAKDCENPCYRILVCGHQCLRKCKDECICAERCDLQSDIPECCCIIL